MEENDVIIEHPNRDKATSKATKAVVLLLLLVSVALMLIVTIGGWDALQGAKPVQIAYILIYLIMAFYVARWNRGVLPVAAVPGWLDRDETGFAQPTIDSGILAIITALIIPVQILLIGFAMRAFNQAWNVEGERTTTATSRHAAPHPA